MNMRAQIRCWVKEVEEMEVQIFMNSYICDVHSFHSDSLAGASFID